jgi:excisionase family DNA binding protein
MQQLKHSAEVLATACDAGNELASLRAYRISDVCRLTNLGRTTIYAAIKSGALTARRYGRCTIILAEDLTTFLRNLPTIR